MCITKPCTQLHPPPPSSFQPPPSSFQPPTSSLQQLQQYSNQNTTRNWTISPNLGRQIQSCPFWQKIGSSGILEVRILNTDLEFRNSYPKLHFWAYLGPKGQSCPFCLDIGTHGISRMLMLIPTLVLWIFKQKSILDKFGQKSQSCPFCLKIDTCQFEDADSYFKNCFLDFKLKIDF